MKKIEELERKLQEIDGDFNVSISEGKSDTYIPILKNNWRFANITLNNNYDPEFDIKGLNDVGIDEMDKLMQVLKVVRDFMNDNEPEYYQHFDPDC